MNKANSELKTFNLVTNGEANYKIVYTDFYNNLNKHSDKKWDDAAIGFTHTKANELATALNELTGCTFECIPESEKTEEFKAIIFGKSNSVTDHFFDYYQNGVHIKNGDLYLYGHNQDGLANALSNFIEHVSNNEQHALVCEEEGLKWDNIAIKYDIPLPDGLLYEGAYAAAKNGMYFVYENCSKDNFDKYCEQLKAADFTQYFSRQADTSHFAGFYKGTDAAWVYYVHERAEMRIAFEKYQPLPDFSFIGNKVTEPDFTQFGFEYLTTGIYVGSTGTSYVMTLEDGSYAIIDGGGNGTAEDRQAAAKDLYDLLVRRNKRADKKIVIAVWFITHGHSDHYNVCQTFGEMYGKEVTLKYFIYNQPTTLTLFGSSNSGSYSVGVGNEFSIRLAETANDYPGSSLYLVHTGCAFDMGGIFVEFMSTYEDLYNHDRTKHPNDPCMPNAVDEFNDTSTTFRLYFNKGKADEATAFILGDAYFAHGERLASMWDSKYMESTIVQAAHHGYHNGATSGVVDKDNPVRSSTYSAIKAYHCMWSNSYRHCSRAKGVKGIMESANPEVKFYTNAAEDGTPLNTTLTFNGGINVTFEPRAKKPVEETV